jgi:hypothetical protein
VHTNSELPIWSITAVYRDNVLLPVYSLKKSCFQCVDWKGEVARDRVAQNAMQNRVTGPSNHLPTAEVTGVSTLGPTEPLTKTMAADDEMGRLIAAVTNMATSQPPIPFGTRFLLTSETVKGGQGIVVFARGGDAAMRPYAIKCAPITLGRVPIQMQLYWMY